LFSDDVPHGVVVEGLGIDLNFEKKHSKEVIITPLEVGDFEGRCSRYCGSGHRAMTLIVHVAG
jgi:cytochrome c oxidase subunit II